MAALLRRREDLAKMMPTQLNFSFPPDCYVYVLIMEHSYLAVLQ
jgi:hypothetical protein